MKDRSVPKIKFFLFLAVLVFSCTGFSLAQEIREPYVAGSFYPSDKDELNRMIDHFLAKVPDQNKETDDLVALIVPHAGYRYSGQVAAYAYKRLVGLSFDTVILIGPFHKALFYGASVWKSGVWKTPLGDVEVDSELAESISKENKEFKFIPQAHLTEHSLEVQIPFLQKVLKNFKIVPIVVSDPSLENCRLLSSAILKSISDSHKKILIIASTDMSHYHPDEIAQKMDQAVLDSLAKGDLEELFGTLSSEKGELCGGAATLTLLEIAKLISSTEVHILKHATSGDVTGDKSSVVGYSASVIYKKQNMTENRGGNMLSEAQQKQLLKIARQAIETYLATGQSPEPAVDDSFLREPRAVFVTLRKGDALRGCIGRTVAVEPLYLAVRNMAIESATHDFRFEPVRREELKDLTIEISALSPPQKVKSADEIVMGKHGVTVVRGNRSGVFLPKVATETGWSREEFLNELCFRKAGLSPDAWKDPATELYVFTAQDFGETEAKKASG